MTQTTSPSLFLRLALCLLILGAGGGGFIVLKKMKKPPVMVDAQEQALPVQVIQVSPEQVEVVISGYGEVRSRSMVPLSAEVAGRITSVHDNLQVGLVVNRGEVLCRINDQDYRLEFDAARTRLQSLKRDLELARKEFARVSDLYKKKRVGTLSSVEKAEQTVNGIVNQRAQVQQAMEMAALRLERCVIRAPFTCRITELTVEQDEYVTPGRKLFTIVDDSDLELLVSLDSRDAVNWLRFKPGQDRGAWFGPPSETVCAVHWTENNTVQGTGRLDRVVRFDSQTRTLVVAVRLNQESGTSFPLVQGMFCRVDIKGRPLTDVFVMPRRAVDFEGRVFVVEKSRLHSRTVQVARVQDNKALVTKGLRAGETVIITRLESPLENTLVRVEQAGAPGQ
jgi:RND family efflux transporter MFP subunit